MMRMIPALSASPPARPRLPARSVWASALVLGLALFGARSAEALLISEVMFNPDGGEEFVELFNDGSSSILLDDYSLGWGGDDYTTGTLDLDGAGTLLPGDYFVVGGPASAFDFTPELENGFVRADGVALFDVEAAAIPGATPIDALIYGTWFAWNLSDLVDETGAVGGVDAVIGGAGESAVRDADGSWTVSNTPTPGTGPLAAAVPEPGTAVLLGLGIAGLAIHARRVPVLQPRVDPLLRSFLP